MGGGSGRVAGVSVGTCRRASGKRARAPYRLLWLTDVHETQHCILGRHTALFMLEFIFSRYFLVAEHCVYKIKSSYNGSIPRTGHGRPSRRLLPGAGTPLQGPSEPVVHIRGSASPLGLWLCGKGGASVCPQPGMEA